MKRAGWIGLALLAGAIPVSAQTVTVSAGPALRGASYAFAHHDWGFDGAFVRLGLERPLRGRLGLHLGAEAVAGESVVVEPVCVPEVLCQGGELKGSSYAVHTGLTLGDARWSATVGPALVLVPHAAEGDLIVGGFADLRAFPLSRGLADLGLGVTVTRLGRTTGGIQWVVSPGLVVRF